MAHSTIWRVATSSYRLSYVYLLNLIWIYIWFLLRNVFLVVPYFPSRSVCPCRRMVICTILNAQTFHRITRIRHNYIYTTIYRYMYSCSIVQRTQQNAWSFYRRSVNERITYIQRGRHAKRHAFNERLVKSLPAQGLSVVIVVKLREGHFKSVDRLMRYS